VEVTMRDNTGTNLPAITQASVRKWTGIECQASLCQTIAFELHRMMVRTE
jgi:hypothetical protein